MESATPTKFKSSVLAALDFKPSLDYLESHKPVLAQTKRKHTPGSPDPRQPKRVAAGVQPDVPGLENVIRECYASLI